VVDNIGFPIDLHLHSIASDDGEFKPQEIINQALANHMTAIAIADHNTVAAISLAMQTKSPDLKLIPAIEIDCQYDNQHFHLLGYHINYKDPAYEQLTKHIHQLEQQASSQRIKNICALTGLSLDVTALEQSANNGIITGELIAQHLLTHPNNLGSPILEPYISGIRSTRPLVNFYWDFFAPGQPAHVPIAFPNLTTMVELIHHTGGKAIIAHPSINVKHNEALLNALVACGIDGLEVLSSYHQAIDIDYYYQYAYQHNLYMTCGSDFHGYTKPDIQLGQYPNHELFSNHQFIKQLQEFINLR
jgi:3',5'-nucleoside bisphosphate phosphatase